MSAKTRLKDLALSESGFVFDPYWGGTFTANGTGLAILHALQKGLGRTAIVQELCREFAVKDADVENDLGEFLRMLVGQGLLPQDFVLDAAEHIEPPSASAADGGPQ